MLKAVARHTDQKWILLYVERWLKAPMQKADGALVRRTKGTPQGRSDHAPKTIASQFAALREYAAQSRLDVPEDWVFADEGHSGATLARPALEALWDLVAQGCLDVVLVYSPDRLARKFAYQALLIEELARAGTRVEFVVDAHLNFPTLGDTPPGSLGPGRLPPMLPGVTACQLRGSS